MKRESKLTNVLHGGITSSWFLALLLIGVTLGPDRAQAQPFAYVTNFGDGTVSVIDTATNLPVVPDITVESAPTGVAITPDGKRAYVTNQFSGTVSVIDTDPASPNFNTVIATVNNFPTRPQGCNCPYGIAITPDGKRAYVANNGSSSVSVIDTNPANVTPPFNTFNTVIATVPLPVVPLVSFPSGIAITPDGKRAYVANGSSHMVSVIDTNPANLLTTFNTVVANVTLLVGSSPFWVAITPDGSRVYVTNSGELVEVSPGFFVFVPGTTVSVIDNSPLSPPFAVIDTVTVGSGPVGVAVNPAGTFVYVTNQVDNPGTVSVIDTTNNNTIPGPPIPVGSFPTGVAIAPLSTIVPFAKLTAKVEIEKHEIEVQATFTLGPGSNGIDPRNEAVSLKLTSSQFETFSITIPALSFNQDKKQDKKGSFKFKGVIDDVALEVVIARLGNGSFVFKAEGKGANLTSTRPRTRNQVEVELIIGDDGGSPTATAYSRF